MASPRASFPGGGGSETITLPLAEWQRQQEQLRHMERVQGRLTEALTALK